MPVINLLLYIYGEIKRQFQIIQDHKTLWSTAVNTKK